MRQTDAMPACKRPGKAGTSAGVALLPLVFAALGIGAIAVAAGLSARTRLAAVTKPSASAVAAAPSPGDEARLAAQMTAFALAKVAPERFESEPRAAAKQLPASGADARASARIALYRSDRPAAKVATVLPPRRPLDLGAAPPPVATAVEQAAADEHQPGVFFSIYRLYSVAAVAASNAGRSLEHGRQGQQTLLALLKTDRHRCG